MLGGSETGTGDTGAVPQRDGRAGMWAAVPRGMETGMPSQLQGLASRDLGQETPAALCPHCSEQVG